MKRELLIELLRRHPFYKNVNLSVFSDEILLKWINNETTHFFESSKEYDETIKTCPPERQFGEQ